MNNDGKNGLNLQKIKTKFNKSHTAAARSFCLSPNNIADNRFDYGKRRIEAVFVAAFSRQCRIYKLETNTRLSDFRELWETAFYDTAVFRIVLELN